MNEKEYSTKLAALTEQGRQWASMDSYGYGVGIMRVRLVNGTSGYAAWVGPEGKRRVYLYMTHDDAEKASLFDHTHIDNISDTEPVWDNYPAQGHDYASAILDFLNRFGWCQRMSHNDKTGESCLLGAIASVVHPEWRGIVGAKLTSRIRWQSYHRTISEWNDAATTTFADVIRLLNSVDLTVKRSMLVPV